MEAFPSSTRIYFFTCLIFVCVISEESLEINDIVPITTPVSANLNECGADEACVRFCCDNKTLCSNQEYFNKSSMAVAEDLDESFRILKGAPPCHKAFGVYEQSTNWSFLKVSEYTVVIDMKPEDLILHFRMEA